MQIYVGLKLWRFAFGTNLQICIIIRHSVHPARRAAGAPLIQHLHAAEDDHEKRNPHHICSIDIVDGA